MNKKKQSQKHSNNFPFDLIFGKADGPDTNIDTHNTN